MFQQKLQNYKNEDRCFLSGPCKVVIYGTSLEFSHLWDLRQPVRKLAEDILNILYRETTSEDIKLYMCCSYSDL
jgi:hypothetical protein